MTIPFVLGFFLDSLTLTVYLISITASSATLVSTQFNAGAALDNTKKIVDEGLYGDKVVEEYAAFVIGDTF